MRKEKILFVCNSVYQVLVALWIQHKNACSEETEFLISDHMNGGKEIANKINQLQKGYRAFYIQTHEYCYQLQKSHVSAVKARYYRLFPGKLLQTFVSLSGHYKQVYIANIENFTKLLINSLGHKRKKPEIILYEDGSSTYSKNMGKWYQNSGLPNYRSFRSKLGFKIFRDYPLKGNIQYALVFNPDLMTWTPSENRALEKIDTSDQEFLNMVNYVFQYKNAAKEYDKKYIFLEESFFADGNKVNDTDLVESLAERIGKENIMVKIHPRNPINRFKELGYKTNSNTSIPWEVICMNLPDIKEKVLVTIASSATLNPKLVFNQDVKVYSLYNLIDDSVKKNTHLNDSLWVFIKSVFEKYPNEYKIVNSIEEVE